jgi:hypothetical protein
MGMADEELIDHERIARAFRSDEPVESGGTAGAPFPLHYFVAGVGF